MTEEEVSNDSDFVADLVAKLFGTGNFNHLDGYGGALLALDLIDATKSLKEEGWRISKESNGD